MTIELDPKFKSYLQLMAQKGASDLFFTTGAPPSIKIEGEVRPVVRAALEAGAAREVAYRIMNAQQIETFERTKEMNLGLTMAGVGRFRINVYLQRGEVSLVVRYLKTTIPTVEELNLPPLLKDLVMLNNGLVLVVGSTGSGKSTTLAAMIEHRNTSRGGHILTIEDPIEYLFTHKRSIVGQREVGLDTLSYENALREAMREAPDLIMIGEIRDQVTMKAANAYADTGHLVLSTLHAVNANQAFDRIVNFFPPEARRSILMDLSLNLRAIVSQRLVTGNDGMLLPAVEILVNTPYVAELIRDGKIGDLKEAMEKGENSGMQSFDQSLYWLYRQGKISLAAALEKADSRSQLEWRINFGGGVRRLNGEAEELVMPARGEAGANHAGFGGPAAEEGRGPVGTSTPSGDAPHARSGDEGYTDFGVILDPPSGKKT